MLTISCIFAVLELIVRLHATCDRLYYAGGRTPWHSRGNGFGEFCQVDMTTLEENCTNITARYVNGMAVHPITFEIYIYGSTASQGTGSRSLFKFSMDDIDGTWETIFTHTDAQLSGITFGGCVAPDGEYLFDNLTSYEVC